MASVTAFFLSVLRFFFLPAHQIFETLSYSGTLKINLHLDSTLVRLVYTPKSDNHNYLIMESGELNLPPNLDLEGRLSLEDSMCVLTDVKASDAGVFSVTDLQGFLVSDVHLEIAGEEMQDDKGKLNYAF